ncbi:MAG: hypothetical protein LAN59_16145 [Acidobacteriia bacterium]|nr:hypothetical protein [Terriglobia bacterium]
MAHVKITDKDGRVYEVSEISIDEVRQLLSSNGNGHGHLPRRAELPANSSKRHPNYHGLKAVLSDGAKRFFKILHDNPSGISADHLVEKLGFRTSNQIGGVTGGGIGKQAPKFHVKPDDLYTIVVTRDESGRRVIYKPGPEIEKVL